MKKGIYYTIIIIILLVLGGGIWWLSNNTSLLHLGDKTEEIVNNNFNNQTNTTVNQNVNSSENINSPEPEPELDLETLVTKNLTVPEEFAKGVFSKDRMLNLPDNFEISVFVAGLSAPRFFDFDAEGNMIVADKGANKIFLVKDSDDNGVVDEIITVDEGLQVMHSVDYYKGDLYAGEEDKVTVYRDLQTDGTYRAKEVLVPDLPSGGGHSTRTVLVGPDEKLYVSIGSSCNVCEETDERRAAVMQYDLDGTNGVVFAEGLRNAVGIEFYNGNLWSVNNGRDRIGDNLPEEEVDILEAGKHYGWPYCYGKGVADPNYPSYADFCQNDATDAVYLMQAHSAPLGLTFYPETTELPSQLEDNMFIGFHGSWNRSVPTGYKVVRIDTSNPESETVNFITGWLEENGEEWGRPVGVGFDSEGVFYVSDDKAGAVYRVTYTK